MALGALALALPITAVLAQTAQQAPRGAMRAPMADMTRQQAQARAEQHFARMDANQDGKVDAADRTARHAARFDQLDTNRDGALSREEFAALQGDRADRRGNHRMGQRGDRGHHGARAGQPVAVDRATFVARALERFDRADANRDGTITTAEHQAMREARRAEWRAQRQQDRAGSAPVQ